jgi:tetraacyldisaccharide 4'-kinase
MNFATRHYEEVLSGRRRTIGAALLRSALRIAEVPYGAAVRSRNGRYDALRAPIHRVEVPVISVGNLTTGGSGKTPMVEWLARWFVNRNVHAGIVSRGYRSRPGRPNDEARELARRLPDVPHVQQPDRVAAARAAIADHDCQVLLLDDGFQHRRLHRDLDLVLLDALEPFGFGHLLPRGLLREPVSSLSRADAVILTRADIVSAERKAAIRNLVRRHAPRAAWIEAAHRPLVLANASGHEREIAWLRGRRVAAFCGIGNPRAFELTLAQCGCHVAEMRAFPDHHDYLHADIDSLARWVRSQSDIEAVVCTEKDLVKIGRDELGAKPLWAVRIGIELVAGQQSLESLLGQLIPRAAAAA